MTGNKMTKEIVQYKDDVEVARFKSQVSAAKTLKVSQSTINGCLRGRINTCKGYTFKYVDLKSYTDGKIYRITGTEYKLGAHGFVYYKPVKDWVKSSKSWDEVKAEARYEARFDKV